MSNSYKKTPVMGYVCCDSEKQDKRLANRRFPRIIRYKIQSNNFNLPQLREVSNVWAFGKDGKRYRKNIEDKDMRK